MYMCIWRKKYPYDCFVCVCYKKLTTYTAKVHKYKKNIIKFTKNSFVAACMNEIKSDHHNRNPTDSADVIAVYSTSLSNKMSCVSIYLFATRNLLKVVMDLILNRFRKRLLI